MINKDRNTNLQITISKDASIKLDAIIKKLEEQNGIKPTKSQAIQMLIFKYRLK